MHIDNLENKTKNINLCSRQGKYLVSKRFSLPGILLMDAGALQDILVKICGTPTEYMVVFQ